MRMAPQALLVPALLLIGLPLAAQALSIGSVRQVGDLRELELPANSLDCPTSDGLVDHWEFSLDFDPYETWFQLRRSTRDGLGREVEAARLVLERDIEPAGSVARQCRDGGGVLISTYTREPACERLIEELDRDGGVDASHCIEASGRYGFPGRWYLSDLSLGDGSFLVVGLSRVAADSGGTVTAVGAAHYGIGEGWVEGEAGFVGSEADSVFGVAAATDGVGGVLLIWSVDDDEEGVTVLWARRLERSGNPVGEPIRVYEYPTGRRRGSSVVASGPGEFVVGWRGPQGHDWLGRSVHFGSTVTTTVPTTSTSTTTLISYNVPRLDHTVELGAADWIGESDLATDGKGTWMAVWRAPSDLGRARALVAASWNDGRTWSEPLALPEATLAWQYRAGWANSRSGVAIATDGEGIWVAALMRQPGRWECTVEFVRSTDNGRSWQPSGFEGSQVYDRIVGFWETYDDHHCHGTDISWAGSEEWIFAMSSLADGDGYFSSAQIFVASSDDGGLSWHGGSWPREDAIDEGSNSAPAIATAPNGATIVAWRTNDLRAMQWSGPPAESLLPVRAPHTWIEGLDPYPETWLHPYGLSLAAGAEGAMLAAWPARDLDGSVHGWDPDIVVARSADLGSTWSTPAAVAPYALWDGSLDSSPVIASGPANRYLLAWNSYLGDRQYPSGEVLLALSDDAGLSWSRPVVAADFASSSGSVVQGLTGDEHGTWALLTISSPPPEAHAPRLVLSMTSSNCGDGVVDGSEACDDGNAIEGDGCDTNCTATECGNGILSAGELCDDGNPWPGDACSPLCEPTFCGDGIVHVGTEWCDDGNVSESDACLSACELAKCGDAIVWQGEEQCDDANEVEGDGCDSNCTLTGCGNGIVTEGEECDDGDDDEMDACLSTCQPNVCGDGYRKRAGRDREHCDDGNIVDGDGCDSNCQLTGCGNGIVTAGEDCDDGNRNDHDYCGRDCRFDECGNGRIGRHGAEMEECDDGNLVDGDGCDSNCRLTRCGNGVASDDEDCDDANASNLDACLNRCEHNGCGDGYVWVGREQCDDGNLVDGDGCSAACEVEGVCGDANGDGVVTATDARHVLAYSVALLRTCSAYVCDVDADGYVTIRDARTILLRAVGLSDEALCVANRLTVVFQLATPVAVGALQFNVDYSGASGEFAGDWADAECTSMLGSTFLTFNNELGQRVLRVALVNLSGVQGPASVASCTFLSTGAFDPARLRVEVVDAAGPGLTPIVPLPVVTLSAFAGHAG